MGVMTAAVLSACAPPGCHQLCTPILVTCRDAGLLTAATAALIAGGGVDEASQETLSVVGRALIWPLELLAQQHRAHELLYNVCELLLIQGLMDRQRLLGWMQQEVQEATGALPADSFTFYVMERYKNDCCNRATSGYRNCRICRCYLWWMWICRLCINHTTVYAAGMSLKWDQRYVCCPVSAAR